MLAVNYQVPGTTHTVCIPARPTATAVSLPCPLLSSQVLREGITVLFLVTGKDVPRRCRGAPAADADADAAVLALHGELSLVLAARASISW